MEVVGGWWKIKWNEVASVNDIKQKYSSEDELKLELHEAAMRYRSGGSQAHYLKPPIYS